MGPALDRPLVLVVMIFPREMDPLGKGLYLEKDHATEHEHVEILIAGRYGLPKLDVGASARVLADAVDAAGANGVEVQLKVLPVERGCDGIA
jgi:hypothetical protein